MLTDVLKFNSSFLRDSVILTMELQIISQNENNCIHYLIIGKAHREIDYVFLKLNEFQSVSKLHFLQTPFVQNSNNSNHD